MPASQESKSNGKQRVDTGRFWQLLQDIEHPDGDRDIVAEGLILNLDEEDGVLSIQLDGNVCDEDELLAVAGSIQDAFDEVASVRRVRVLRSDAEDDEDATAEASEPETSRPMTPLQAELMEEGKVPEPDPIGQASTPPNHAPGAGYSGSEGPPPLEGPGGIDKDDALAATYEGELAVFQWEIDPADPSADSGEAHIEEEDWEYRIWWQNHPEGLTYASLRAIGGDTKEHDGEARPHAVGRAIVVNLVYDREREGVIAVYGTTRDFRPFIDAFRRGFFDQDE